MAKQRAMMIGLDGADPAVIKRLIKEGRLPNFKKFLEQGVAHESLGMLGVNPTVTPPNWASMATGNWPRTHGVTDFYTHTLGNPFELYQMNWDSRLVQSEFIWEAFERGGKKAVCLNYCEAWPPRVEGTQNIFVDGTGASPFLRDFVDFQKVAVFSPDEEKVRYFPHYVDPSSVGDCIVYSDQIDEMVKEQEEFESQQEEVSAAQKFAGSVSDLQMFERPGVEKIEVTYPEITNTLPPIKFPTNIVDDNENDEGAEATYLGASADTIYSPFKPGTGWKGDVPEDAYEGMVLMNSGLERRHVLIYTTNSKFDTVSFYKKKDTATLLGTAVGGEDPWSDFIYDEFMIDDEKKKVAYRIRVLETREDPVLVSIFIAQALIMEDPTYFYPESLMEDFWKEVGPCNSMASYDRYTAISDKVTMESFAESYNWHAKASDYLLKKVAPDWDLFYLHIHGIDTCNHWYINQAVPGGHPEWERIKHDCVEGMYEITDKLIGYYMTYLDENTHIILTSDHAAIPHAPGYKNPGFGEMGAITTRVMRELGLCSIYKDEKDKNRIDWSKTTAIMQRSAHVYINLKGRDPQGIVEPEDYQKTVDDVISKLYSYRDPVSGDRLVSFCMTREEMEAIGMGGPHCGDIYVQVTRNFGMEHSNCMSHVTNFGYSLLCLCMMAGGSFKKGETIPRPIRLVDIAPTISYVCDAPMPRDVEGGVIYQAIDKPY